MNEYVSVVILEFDMRRGKIYYTNYIVDVSWSELLIPIQPM